MTPAKKVMTMRLQHNDSPPTHKTHHMQQFHNKNRPQQLHQKISAPNYRLLSSW